MRNLPAPVTEALDRLRALLAQRFGARLCEFRLGRVVGTRGRERGQRRDVERARRFMQAVSSLLISEGWLVE